MAAPANAQWFADENVSAWVDLRGRLTDNDERAWLNQGFGKTRYDKAGLNVGEAALVWRPRLAAEVSANIHLLFVPDSKSQLGINEAFIRYKPVPTSATRFDLRVGRFYPPVSLEHDGEGWTPTRTITPSAGNSWIAEEVMVNGVEATVRHRLDDQEVGFGGSIFRGNDTAGTLLAFRGFAMHDVRSTGASRLALPVAKTGFAAMIPKQAPFSNPVAEVDNHPGYYVKLFWKAPFSAHTHIVWYDNQADPRSLVKGQYGWATQFLDLAVRYEVSPNTQILGQYMNGTTRMGPVNDGKRHAVDARFESAYLMATHKVSSDLSLSLRGDYFRIKDRSNQLNDNNNETGRSVTVALVKRLNERLDIATEFMNVRSERPSRYTLDSKPIQEQNLIQINVRIHIQRNEYIN